MTRHAALFSLSILALLPAGGAGAEEALVAVAANFAGAAEAMVPVFHAATGHDLVLTTGSTGKLYAQIGAGAPFDVMLSADFATPERLVAEGKAEAASLRVYAIGQLALWSPDPAQISGDPAADLARDPAAGGIRHLAIANPELAPYGAAAQAALQQLGLWDGVQERLVTGENIGQTFALVQSGAAEAGFVAASALKAPDVPAGSVWMVPQDLFPPIAQGVAILAHGAGNPAAAAFADWLKGPEAAEIMAEHGYQAGGA